MAGMQSEYKKNFGLYANKWGWYYRANRPFLPVQER